MDFRFDMVIIMYGWEASPLAPIPEKERLREVDGVNPLGICKGGCNRLCKIQNKTYQKKQNKKNMSNH